MPSFETWPELRFDLPDLTYRRRLNCAAALLDRWVEVGHGERLCVVSPSEQLTYAGLRARAEQVASVLVEEHGMVPGNRALLRGPNNPWLVAAWFGVMKAGAVAVTTMPLLRPGELVKAAYKYPRAQELVDALPRTSTGKVQRYVLRANTP